MLRPPIAVINSNGNNPKHLNPLSQHNYRKNQHQAATRAPASQVGGRGAPRQQLISVQNVVTSQDRNYREKTTNNKSNNSNEDDSVGPYDFRKLLRKTNHAPTETLRRCKGLKPFTTDKNDPLVNISIRGRSVEL